MVDNTVEKELLYKQFVEDMAAFTAPTDPDQVAQARKDYGHPSGHVSDEDIVEAMMTGDREAEDASVLWSMIARAREILAHE